MIDYDYALIAIHERPDRRFPNACVVVDLSFGRPQHKALCLRCGFNRVTLLLRVFCRITLIQWYLQPLNMTLTNVLWWDTYTLHWLQTLIHRISKTYAKITLQKAINIRTWAEVRLYECCLLYISNPIECLWPLGISHGLSVSCVCVCVCVCATVFVCGSLGHKMPRLEHEYEMWSHFKRIFHSGSWHIYIHFSAPTWQVNEKRWSKP